MGGLAECPVRDLRVARVSHENFSGHPAQIAHRQHVIDRLVLRPDPYRVGVQCFVKRTVPAAAIAARYSDEHVEKAKAAVSDQSPAAEERLDVDSVQPACFVVQAHTAEQKRASVPARADVCRW
jgi:hypothetical protein